MKDKKFYGCILLYCDEKEYTTDNKEIHYYMGYSDRRIHPNQFVKSYKDGIFELTTDITESYVFDNDEECNGCLEAMVKSGAVTICSWEYTRSSKYARIKEAQEHFFKDFGLYAGYGYAVMPPIPFEDALKQSLKETSGCSMCVMYPNKNWWRNDGLIPALINESIDEWRIRHGYEPQMSNSKNDIVYKKIYG